MRALAFGLVIVGFLSYALLIGAIIIWPIFNILAYLKVLFFPRPIRKRYGTDLSKLSKESFKIEITDQDNNDIKKYKAKIKRLQSELKTKIELINKNISTLNSKVSNLSNKISALGDLKKNNDGSYSQRSSIGKEAYSLDSQKQDVESQIYNQKREIEHLKYDSEIAIDEINDDINDIKNKPWSAWYEWQARYARYLSNRRAILFMFTGFPVLFFILGNGNFAYGLNAYVYISYVQPISSFFGLDNFVSGFSSYFISYEYAESLFLTYQSTFSFWSWIFYVLTMPVITGLLAYFSYKSLTKKSEIAEPDFYHYSHS